MNDSSGKQLVNCAVCGAVMESHHQTCWLCDERADVGSEVNPYRATLVVEPPVPTAAGSSAAVLGLAVALAAVCGGVATFAPGAAIGLVALLFPAFIRTVVVSSRAGPAGLAAGNAIYTFIASLGAVLCAGAAGAGAFFATCFVACLGIGTINSGGGASSDTDWIAISLMVGGLIGVATALLVLYAFWKRREPRFK